MKSLSFSHKIAFVILLLFAILNVFRIKNTGTQNNSGIDLRTIYLGSELWQKKLNPYNDGLLKSEWAASMPEEVKSHKVKPGLPSIPLLYPPTALVLFTPLTVFKWPDAMNIYLFLELICIFFIIYFTLKIVENYQIHQNVFFITIALFSFKAVFPSVWVCQPTWPVLAMLFGAWYFMIKEKIFWAGILCGLAFVKFTLAFPVFIFLFIIAGKSKWKVLLYTAIPQLILLGIYFFNTDIFQFKIQINSWMEVAAQYRHYIFDSTRTGYPFTYELTSITETGVLLPSARAGLYLFIVALSGFLVYLNRNKIRNNAPEFYLLCSVTFLCISHHLYYDILLLFPGLFFVKNLNGFQKILAIVILTCFLLPFTAIINYLGNPPLFQWLQFSNSIGCILMLVLIWYRFGVRFMEK